MTRQRLEDLLIGLANLPNLDFPEVNGRNGEELATDEAAVYSARKKIHSLSCK